MEAKSTSTAKRKSSAEVLREKKIRACLDQIGQQETLITLLTQEQEALLGQDMAGLRVAHRQFGAGEVCAQDGLTVCVRFWDGVRRFAYPGAFLDGFLSGEDEALIQRLAQYQDLNRQIQEARQGIAQADHAMALLKK